MGGGNDEAEEQAKKSYELQKEQLELQKKQMAEITRKEREAELLKTTRYSEYMKKYRRGRASTLLTDFESLGAPNINKKSLYA